MAIGPAQCACCGSSVDVSLYQTVRGGSLLACRRCFEYGHEKKTQPILEAFLEARGYSMLANDAPPAVYVEAQAMARLLINEVVPPR